MVLKKSREEILKTEYSERFDEIRKNMMETSYYKYGPLKKNYDTYKCLDAVANARKRIEMYEQTGNTEYLADAANFCMIEFMMPQKEGARYVPTASGSCETVGVGILQIEAEAEGIT